MEKASSLQDLAFELYAFLARRFPVCCWSDEFVFFPQAVQEETDWSRWDDLSPESVEDVVTSLGWFRRRLGDFATSENAGVHGERALVSVLVWVTRTLEEQFTLVKTHATQPTFALTVATVGLVQALQSGGDRAWFERIRALPEFLEGALESLQEVPELYRDLGMGMAASLTGWIQSIGRASQSGLALKALDSFTDRLSMTPVTREFALPPDLFEHVVHNHTGSALTMSEVLCELEDEAAVTKQLLTAEAGNLGYGRDWESAFSDITGEQVPADGKKGLLRLEMERLRDHCLCHGFPSESSTEPDSLSIEFLPSSLDSIRAADSYNAIPGHPFRGGIFYIFGDGSLGSSSGSLHPVFRMTVAHETYPGHHLLDLSRWNNPQPALRSLEYPLFYEGWACFGEDLMLHTGAFDRSYDRLILLRRRFRHAVRGKVDLMLHSGEMGLEEAAGELMTAGFSRNRALGTVRKYALRPAYQMCYTIGRRRFQRLFDSYGQESVGGFVNTVLTQGEVLFEDLECALKSSREGERESGGAGEKPVTG
ncbi:MAG: DUF885 family protein [bacterium]|nr:DUF885 family protein [bacterium]MDT8364895.1 DUF885 family protein [bacterium]